MGLFVTSVGLRPGRSRLHLTRLGFRIALSVPDRRHRASRGLDSRRGGRTDNKGDVHGTVAANASFDGRAGKPGGPFHPCPRWAKQNAETESAMNDLEKLLISELRAVYDAEKQLA